MELVFKRMGLAVLTAKLEKGSAVPRFDEIVMINRIKYKVIEVIHWYNKGKLSWIEITLE